MKLPFENPVWTSLYGPYGVKDVPGILTRLQTRWDQVLANDFYWEMLHHQEDLYPVTYAALPWLWSLAPKDLENLSFFSWVIYCAARIQPDYGTEAGSPSYAGLRPSAVEANHPYHDLIQVLLQQHGQTLDELAKWCDVYFPIIAQTCLSMLPHCGSLHQVSYLLMGPMALDDAEHICRVLEMRSDEHSLDFIIEEMGPWSEANQIKALKWADVLEANCREGAEVLRDFAREASPSGVTARCAETPDLFG